MNPYEYETTLDCRDDTRAVGGGGGGGVVPLVVGSMTPRHPHSNVTQQNTLHHQNQQNLQLQQQQQQQQMQGGDSQSSYYDYEYQHLPHRGNESQQSQNPPSSTSTAARTHGRQGMLNKNLLKIGKKFYKYWKKIRFIRQIQLGNSFILNCCHLKLLVIT
ncbi:teneurin-m-like isoform X1 [Lucilia sericata]|uniref:teneurin-m-like isoform X1 n=2 Tax=Lucilia sericata TaxID=13632 RepID=UPI0018A85F29|nr:teneurin-m-like isoform X1 [Lucilia sericata]